MGLRESILQQPQEPPADRSAASAPCCWSSPALFYLVQRGRDLPAALVTNRVLLFVLWYVNVVLILVVLFVLLRNLIKLLVERRHRMLGSTFKFKLVATYVGLSLIPVLLLFAIATELLQGSIDRWFNTPRGAGAGARQRRGPGALRPASSRTNLRDAARGAARDRRARPAATREQRPRLTRRLQELLAELDLDFLAVYEGREFVHAVLNSQSGIPDLPEPDRVVPGGGGERRAGHAPSRRRRAAGEPADGRPWPRPAPPGRAGERAPRGRRSSSSPGTLLDPVLAEQQRAADRRTTRPTASSRCRRTTCGRATC